MRGTEIKLPAPFAHQQVSSLIIPCFLEPDLFYQSILATKKRDLYTDLSTIVFLCNHTQFPEIPNAGGILPMCSWAWVQNFLDGLCFKNSSVTVCMRATFESGGSLNVVKTFLFLLL